MILRFLFVFVSLLTLMTGCLGRTPPNVRVSLDQMQAELMAVEDRYYELEYKYKLAQQELAACRGKNGECPVPESSGEYYDIEMGAENGPVIIDSSPGVEFSPESYEVIESPKFASKNVGSSLADEPELRPHDPTFPSEADGVTHILLVPQRTGGLDRDGDLADDGLVVTLLPQNADGRAVIKPGAVMVSVIDPAEVGQEQRIGLWEFTGKEVARLIASSKESAPGISLELPWQGRSPRHNNLMVYVRYINDSHQNLEASMDVSINIPGKIARRQRPPATDVSNFTNPLRIAKAGSTAEHLVAPASVFIESQTKLPGDSQQETDVAEKPEWQPLRNARN